MKLATWNVQGLGTKDTEVFQELKRLGINICVVTGTKKKGKGVIWIGLVGLMMVCSSCLIFVYDPLQLIIKRIFTFGSGTLLFRFWTSPPYDVVLKMYIFNVTNSEKFFRGEEKMRVEEIGPYAYKEILTNNNATFNSDGTVTFEPKREFRIDEENSVRDASTDRIIIPNIPLLGIQSYLATESNVLTNLAFSTFSAFLGSEPFLNVTVEEFLWGYEDKLIKLANTYIPSWIDFETFGLFERLMSRDNFNKVRISTNPEKTEHRYSSILSQEETMAPFHIVDVNDSPGLLDWGYDNSSDINPKKCLLVQGAFEGTLFPMKIKKNVNLKLFRKAFCRPVELEYVDEGYTPQGFKTLKYTMHNQIFASPEKNPNNICYCHNGQCPSKGIQPISACYYDIPVSLSLPHFLNSDSDVFSQIDGLSPNPDLHSSVAYIHPDLGIPLDGNSLKIQVNLGVPQTKFNSKTKPFNDLTIPLFWIELTCTKLPTFVNFILSIVEPAPTIQTIIMYLLGLIGLAMFSGAALLLFVFSKNIVPRNLSMTQEYLPLPIISINSEYLTKELRICK